MERPLNAAQRLERRVAFATVLAPMAGTVGAACLFWQTGKVSALDLGLLAGMFVLTGLGITAGLHRYFSHRSFRAHPAVELALGIFGSMAGQGPVLYWAAIHRKHHKYSDKPGDPHSPHLTSNRLAGLWHAHVGWLFHPEPENWSDFAPDLLRDRRIFWLNQWYPLWVALGLILPAAIGGVVSGSWLGALSGLLWGGAVRMFLGHHATWAVNSFGHFSGTRSFATTDQSTNNWTTCLITFGDGWHNNHHAFPSVARHGHAWWQLDLTFLMISALSTVGLVWDVKQPRGTKHSNKTVTQ